MEVVVASNTDYAWAAGFIDGEGHFGARRTKHGTYQVSIQVHQKGDEPLQRLKSIFGGAVYKTGREDIYKWSIQRRALVEQVVLDLWPYLTDVKRNQAHVALSKCKS